MPAFKDNMGREGSHRKTKHGEFSWGEGLRPLHREGWPTSEGGMYGAMCPPVYLRTAESLRPRQARQKPEDRRYPGVRIG
jgi:hypothetical protein